jgi:hypothetical protein
MTPTGYPREPVALSRRGTVILGCWLLLSGVLLIVALVGLWPAVEQTHQVGATRARVRFFGSPLWLTLTADTALLVLVCVTSAIGAFVHSATSFATYVGNRALTASWVWWYLLRMLIGTGLALLFYFAVRAGLLSAQVPSQSINPYGVGALAALVGLFSKQATDKLREVFETMFRTAVGYGDDERKDKATNPTPTIIAVEPPRVPAGSDSVTLTVQGQGFIQQSVVRVGLPGRAETQPLPRTMTYLDSTTIRATLVADDVADVGRVELSVVNPEPGGGTSNTIGVEIHEVPTN